MLEIKRMTEISLMELNEITQISYRALYERFKAGKLKGFSRNGKHYITINEDNEYFNIIYNFIQNYRDNVQFDFSIEEDKDISNQSYKSFYIEYHEMFDFLDALHKMGCLQEFGGTIFIHFIPNEKDKTVYFPCVGILDNKKIDSKVQYDSRNEELRVRQEEIGIEFGNIIKQFDKNNCFISTSLGFGGTFDLSKREGKISAHPSYCLYQNK